MTACLREYAAGRYTPTLTPVDKLEPGTLVADPSEDLQRLDYARGVVQNHGKEVEVSNHYPDPRGPGSGSRGDELDRG